MMKQVNFNILLVRRVHDLNCHFYSGCVWLDEELSTTNFNWIGLWKLVFDNPSKDSIVSFVHNYMGSEEEAIDIKQLYKLYNGDESKIMKIALFLTPEDESRIRDGIRKKPSKYLYSKVFKLSAKQPMVNSLKRKVSTSEKISFEATQMKVQAEPPGNHLTDV